MNKLIAAFITLALTFALPVSAYTVYKKVNKDGTVEYSDKPFPGAIKAKLPPVNTQAPQATIKPVLESIVKPNNKVTDAIDIMTPSNGDTVRNNAGNLTIMVQKQLSGKKEYFTQLFINNKPYLKPFKGTVLKAENLDRGILKIKAQLQNRSGNVLATSSETVVYMHRATVNRSN